MAGGAAAVWPEQAHVNLGDFPVTTKTDLLDSIEDGFDQRWLGAGGVYWSPSSGPLGMPRGRVRPSVCVRSTCTTTLTPQPPSFPVCWFPGFFAILPRLDVAAAGGTVRDSVRGLCRGALCQAAPCSSCAVKIGMNFFKKGWLLRRRGEFGQDGACRECVDARHVSESGAAPRNRFWCVATLWRARVCVCVRALRLCVVLPLVASSVDACTPPTLSSRTIDETHAPRKALVSDSPLLAIANPPPTFSPRVKYNQAGATVAVNLFGTGHMYRSLEVFGEALVGTGATHLPLGAGASDDEALRAIERFGATMVCGWGSRVLQLALAGTRLVRAAEASGAPRKHPLRSGLDAAFIPLGGGRGGGAHALCD